MGNKRLKKKIKSLLKSLIDELEEECLHIKIHSNELEEAIDKTD